MLSTQSGWSSEEFSVKIIEKLHIPIILGMSFLSQHHILVDTRNHTARDSRASINIAKPTTLPLNTTLATPAAQSDVAASVSADPPHTAKHSNLPAPTVHATGVSPPLPAISETSSQHSCQMSMLPHFPTTSITASSSRTLLSHQSSVCTPPPRSNRMHGNRSSIDTSQQVASDSLSPFS